MLSIIQKLPSFAVFFLIVFIYFSETLPLSNKNLVKNSYNSKEAPIVLNNEVDNHVLKKRQRRGGARRRQRNRRQIRNLVSSLNLQLVRLQLQIQSLQQQLSSRVLLLTTTTTMGG
uniref:BZIP domain-containing protein n=1 Tax=Strongyloides stercoralis TaxID=6248 RepID=A0A0K0E0M4_STRER